MKEYRKIILSCSAMMIICFICSVFCYEKCEFAYNYLVGISCSCFLVIIPTWLQYAEEYKRKLNEFRKMIDDLILQILYIYELKDGNYEYKLVYEKTRDICFDILGYESNFDWITRSSGKKALKRLRYLNYALIKYVNSKSIEQAIKYISGKTVLYRLVLVARDMLDKNDKYNRIYNYLIEQMEIDMSEVEKWEEENELP